MKHSVSKLEMSLIKQNNTKTNIKANIDSNT